MLDDEAQARSGFTGEAWQRLVALRKAVDPHGLFLPAHTC
jgi:FAD/FMN-containing dehydrogenase